MYVCMYHIVYYIVVVVIIGHSSIHSTNNVDSEEDHSFYNCFGVFLFNSWR